MADEPTLGNRFFRSLSDKALVDWRPRNERGWFGWHEMNDCANVSAANREMRRRAKIAGLSGPYEWLERIRPAPPLTPPPDVGS